LETRYAAAAGLAHANLKRAVIAVARLMREDPQGADPVPIVRSLLQHRHGGQLLSDELQKDEIHPAVKARVSVFHRDTGMLPDDLVEKFRQSTTFDSLSAELLEEDIHALAVDVERLGDPARGELVYRRPSVACTRCHAIGSAGPAIGPNLVAVGAAAKTHYLVQSILQPNAAIAEHYETRSFLLAGGKIQTGIVTFRNEKEVVVLDASQLGMELRLKVEDIEDEIPAKSLMPAGLADQLNNRSEFLDLVRFISALGKPGEYRNDESPVIRKWRVIAATESGEVPSNDADWQPAYSKVSGVLPPDAFPASESAFARGFINVLVTGVARLEVNSIDGLTLWVDGQQVSDLAAPIRLEKGRRTLTFGFSPNQRQSGIRVEFKTLDNVGRFQPEGGL
jgi:putative heme-binding domain-containing protein